MEPGESAWLNEDRHSDHVVPLSFGRARRYRIAVEALDGGTAAQVVRTYGETEVQVNRAILMHVRRLVVRHVLDHDDGYCRIRDCLAARDWLGRVPAAASTSASA